MKAPKITPGPWQQAEAGSWANGKRTSVEYFVRRPDDDVAIASEILNPDDSTSSEANARAIAALPDLLKDLEAIFKEANGDGSCEVNATRALAKLAKIAKAALIKAGYTI
jgi:hypothetical protein